MPRSLVLVEGESDRTALLTLAGLLGHDLTDVDVMSMGGITNLRRHLAELTGDERVAVLHDARRDAVRRPHAGRATPATVARFVCDADLEDELVRALGMPAVLDVVAGAGDLDAWHILLNQPFHRDRPPEAVLRRFWGTTSGRKDKYAALLTAALEPARVPPPLAGVLAAVG